MRPPAPAATPTRFFVVTFIVSWVIWLPLVFSRLGAIPIDIPDGTRNAVALLGVLTPAIVALWLTAKSGGRTALKALLSRLIIWKTGLRWWGAAMLVWPALLVLTALVYNWLWHNPNIDVVEFTSVAALLVSIIFLLIATLGEEIGWRGVALPGLEQRHSAVRSSTILGLAWACWHIPYWLLQSTYTDFGIAYLGLSFVYVVAGTFYITWFYNHGRFSLLLPVVFHLSYNIVNVAWLPVTMNIGAFAFLVALQLLLTALLVRRLEPRADARANVESGSSPRQT